MKDDTGESLKSYDDFCHALAEENRQAHLLLWLQDIFLQSCICDPRTGEGRFCDLESFLDRLSEALRSPACQDRLSRIAEHTAAAIRNLVASPHEEIRREYRFMPISAVREVDSVTAIWLSRQPGRTLREKLAGKRTIRALSRRWDLNTSENRLLRAFLQRLQELFEAKAKALGKADPSFQDVEQQAARWLMDESVREIGRWENLPPNNLLLSDKNYRKIWDGWTWLMELDRQMAEDAADISARMLRMTFWSLAAALHESPGTTFVQLPCIFWMRRLEAEPLWPWNRDSLYLEGLLRTQNCELHSFRLALTNCLVLTIPKILRLRFQTQGGELKTEVWYQGKSRMVSKFGSKAVMEAYTLVKSLLTKNEMPVAPQTAEPATARLCVMDVSALRPGLSLDGKRQRLPYRLMGQFWNGDKCGRILLDCGKASGLLLTPETPVITSQNIFSPAEHSEKDVAQAALTFFEKIHATIRCRRLHYIIPDNLEDFSLSAVRRQIRLYFPDARPLPRSIGAIFALQHTSPQRFRQYEQVLVLVGSLCGTQLVITPLIGFRDPDLDRQLPEAGGFRWERHPSHVFDDGSLRDSVARILSWDKHNPLSMINIQPLDLRDLEGNVTLYARDGETLKSYDIPAGSSQKMARLSCFRIDTRRLTDVRKKVSGNKSIPCFFLPADCPLHYQAHASHIAPLEKADSVKGGSWIAAWEDKPGCPVLWKDHLPELYMQVSRDGELVYLPLVEEGAIQPQYGQRQKISTVEFSLPPGADFYHFPLTKSRGGAKFRYEAQIRSPSFPLRESVPCTLEMFYTYGAEKPYQLFVLPRNRDTAPFRRIEVEWVRADEVVRASPVPKLPSPYSWQELRNFPKKDGTSRDLIDWMEENFSFIHSRVCFYRDGSVTYQEKGQTYERVYLEDFSSRTAPWKDRETGRFTFLTMPDGRSIYVNEKVFSSIKDCCPQDIREVSFNIFPEKNDPKKLRCCNVSPGKHIYMPPDLKKKFRFPSLQIWRDGRSLADAEAPESLRNAVRVFHEDLEYLAQHDDIDSTFKEECLLCAARMHKDAPGSIWEILRDIAEDGKRTGIEKLLLGSALGDLSLPQQKELHAILLDACETRPRRSDYFGILALAYWRCPSTVSRLTEQEINRLVNALLRAIHGQLEKKDDKFFPRNSTELCELLLALLCTRGSSVPGISRILDANGTYCRELTELVEQIIDIQKEKKFRMHSFVQLEIKKPDSRKAMPDILYAVHRYLTGEDGTDDIVITGVDEGGEDS